MEYIAFLESWQNKKLPSSMFQKLNRAIYQVYSRRKMTNCANLIPSVAEPSLLVILKMKTVVLMKVEKEMAKLKTSSRH